ncbi:MAG: NAD(P)-dependent alcohol dehydrogenase [Chloroflexaceae bacterium]|jgi:NADPH:quinone reductase-like Zn-dependent oxidoreductase|nr:NAD(P)-dependent alcohol dehydrogenase [Chloroflexaceae bacterium]
MRAAVYRTYGPPEVLKIEEIERPTLKTEDTDRVLVKVQYASVTPFDYLHRRGYLPVRPSNGLLRPKDHVLGVDLAGVVEAVGSGVTRFKVGDAVFGNCFGSHAEYVSVREKGLSLLPGNLSMAEAAAMPVAALTALQALKNVAQLKPGQTVLINGAAGGVGHFAVQLARAFGAEVTAVCSTANLAWVQQLGADHMIDYRSQDFTRNGKQYDLVLDAVAKRTYASCKSSLTKTGIYITENPLKPGTQMFQVLFALLTKDKRLGLHLASSNAEDMDLLRGMVEAGKLRPVIEKTYALDQIAEAHRHVEQGHTKGKVVVEVCQN